MAIIGHSEGRSTTSAYPPIADVARPGNEGLLVVESGCGAVAVGSAYLFPPLSSGGASIAEPSTPFPHPAHRTGRALFTHPALGQDITPSHTEGHEQSSDQPPRPCYPSVLRSARLLANRQCHHLGRQWLPKPTPRFSLRFGMRSLPQLSHINGVQ